MRRPDRPCCLTGLLLLAGQHHDHLASFHLRSLLDDRDIGHVLLNLVEQFAAQLLVAHLAPAEADRDLALVAGLMKRRRLRSLTL